MNLLGIAATNFGVFDHLEFILPTEPGLYLVSGENRDYPELGSNGVGKTTLWKAVCFALHGTDADGLKGGELVRDGEDNCYVALKTDTGTLIRRWARNKKLSITLDGTEVSQDEVNKRFGLSRDMFLASTLIAQGRPFFVDLPPVAQVQMLQQLLAMERWLKYADRASKTALRIENELAALTRTLTGLEGERKGINMEDIEARCRDWEGVVAVRREAARETYQQRKEAAEKYDEPDTTLKEQETQLLSQEKRLQNNAGILDRKYDKLQIDISSARANYAQGAQTIKRIEADITFFHTNPQCPTCSQPIGLQHKSACLAEYEKGLAEERQTLAKLKKTGDALLAEQQTVSASRVAIRQSLQAAARRRLEAVRSQERWNADQRAAQVAVDIAHSALQRAEAEVNPHAQSLARAKTRLRELEGQIATVQEQHRNKEYIAQTYTLWTKGFRSIRSQLVNEALTQFELDIAAVLEDLGLSGWSVKPQIDPSVFEGMKIATGFSFAVTNPEGVERDMSGYSGGERQRQRLAVQLGLGSLIQSVNGVSPWSFEVYDEPSSFLSEEGIVGLFRSLKERALRTEKAIFIVDHTNTASGDVDTVYNLVREGGSTTWST